MAHILIMPRQGNTVESCIITDWKVKEGDSVNTETTVCEVETDKATFEVPAGAAGMVLKIIHGAGDDVPVLAPIAVIGAAGENWQAALGNTPEAAVIPDAVTEGTSTPNRPPSLLKQTCNSPNSGNYSGSRRADFQETQLDAVPPVSPRARNLAEKEALPMSAAFGGTGPGGRIIERDVIAALENRPALTAAAKAAGAGAIPESGSGLGGRVTVADMAESPDLHRPLSLLKQTCNSSDSGHYLGSRRADFDQETQLDAVLSSVAPFPSSEGSITETPIKGIRKVISDRMIKSLAESAQFTLNASASVTKLQEIRSGMKAAEGFCGDIGLAKITVNDLVLFAVSRVLPHYPFMNAHKIGETIKTFERVHLGCAVDTPKGLMVPVIRNSNLLSLRQISAEAKRLAAACQNGSAKPDEISGSTFTVSNLGSLGITGFTPVLNAPEVAILGVCNIELKPVAQPIQPAVSHSSSPIPFIFEPHIGFSLTINHQVVDGAPAARFLKALCEAVANIDLLLAGAN